MPETTDRILTQLNAKEVPYEELSTFGHYVSGTKVTDAPEILFARLDLGEVMTKVAELHPPVAAPQKEPEEDADVIDIEPKDEIGFDDFTKQIVSGIKKYYSAEEMVGKKVMVLVNLKPAKLAGVLSEGMLLCAEDAEGNLSLMTPEKDMPAGAEIC